MFADFLAVFLAAFLLGGFAGRWHPAFDTLAVGRLHAAIAGICVLPFASPPILALLLVAVAISIASLLPLLRQPRIGSRSVTLMQKNLWNRNEQIGEVAAHVLQTLPDIVTLQELRPGDDELFSAISAEYPARLVAHYEDHLSMGLAARYPFREGSVVATEGVGLLSAIVEHPAGPVRVASVHLKWPWPWGQAEQARRVLALIPDDGLPLIVGGDFNAVTWSALVQNFARRTGTQARGGLVFSWPFWLRPGLQIDQVLSTHPARISRGPLVGSDHACLEAVIGPLPARDG